MLYKGYVIFSIQISSFWSLMRIFIHPKNVFSSGKYFRSRSKSASRDPVPGGTGGHGACPCLLSKCR